MDMIGQGKLGHQLPIDKGELWLCQFCLLHRVRHNKLSKLFNLKNTIMRLTAAASHICDKYHNHIL